MRKYSSIDELNSKEKQQLAVFLEKAQEIASEWIIAAVEGKETHPKYSNQMFDLYTIARDVINPEELEAVESSDE